MIFVFSIVFISAFCLLFYRIQENSQKIYDLEKDVNKITSLSYSMERMVVENAQDIQRCKDKIDLLENKNGRIEGKNSEST